jgi:hypothetical protein
MGQQLLLLLLTAANQRNLAAQFIITDVSGKLMGKPYILKLRAVHQNYTGPGIGIHSALIVGFGPHLFPINDQFRPLGGLHFKWIHFASLLAQFILRAHERFHSRRKFMRIQGKSCKSMILSVLAFPLTLC